MGPSGLGERGGGAGGLGASTRVAPGRTGNTASGAGPTVRPGLSPLGASTPTGSARSPVSPSSSSSGVAQSPGGGQSQHEVLQNFFQSLLSTKDRNAANAPRSSAAVLNATTTKTNGAATSNEEGN